MRKTGKALLVLFLFICFGFSVCTPTFFYHIPIVGDTLSRCRDIFPWLDYSFAIYYAFICLSFLVLICVTLFLPNKSDFLIAAKGKGRLMFSKRAIESAVRYSYAALDEIDASKVRIRIGAKPEKTRIYVRLTLNNPQRMAPVAEAVQEKIESALQSSLGIAVKYITVKVAEVNSGNTLRKVVDGDSEKESGEGTPEDAGII